MNILFIIPPYRTTDRLVSFLFPIPYGPVLLGTILKEKGHYVEIKDFLIPLQSYKTEPPDSFRGLGAPPYIHYGVPLQGCKKWIKNNLDRFDVIGLAMGQCNIYETGREIGQYVKSLNKPLVIGGPFVTTATEEALDMTGADVAVVGEGEMVCEDAFIKALEGNRSILKGEPVAIAKMPLPDWSLISLYEYPKVEGKMRGVLTASRGCPFKCEFCSVHTIMGYKHRRQSKKRIKKELLNLFILGVRYFCFLDDNLFIDARAVDQVIGAIEELSYERPDFDKCTFYVEEGIEVRVLADFELLKRISSVNFHRLSIGLESLNVLNLKMTKKPYTREMLLRVLENFKKLNISLRAFYILGFDFDTMESVIKDIVEFGSLGLSVRSNNLKLYPATNLTKRYLSEGRIDNSYDWRLSSWYTIDSHGLPFSQIKKLKSLLSSVGKLVEDHGILVFTDEVDVIKDKLSNKNYELLLNGEDGAIIKGNMFRPTPYRWLAEILLLRLGAKGAKSKLLTDGKGVEAVKSIVPKNDIQWFLRKSIGIGVSQDGFL